MLNFTTRKLAAKAWRVTMTIVFIGGSIVSLSLWENHQND